MRFAITSSLVLAAGSIVAAQSTVVGGGATATGSTIVSTPTSSGSGSTTGSAGGPNAFNVPTGGYGVIQAGDTVNLVWQPTTAGTVTLVLRSGESRDLDAGDIIQAGIDNSGSYTWRVPANIARGDSYTVEIVSDADPGVTNYTPPLRISSDADPAQASSVTSIVSFSRASQTSTIIVTSSSSSGGATTTTTSAPETTDSMTTTRRSSSSVSAQSTIDNTTSGAAWRVLPTGLAGAVGAVVGAAAFVL